MTTQTLPKPDAPAGNDVGKPALHSICGICYPVPAAGNVALCGHVCVSDGKAFTGLPPAEWPLCVVCVDLIPRGCPKCGAGL